MAKVKVASRSVSIPQKVLFTRRVVTAMTGNADVPSPTPKLTVMTAAANTLETAYNEAQFARREAVSKTASQTTASTTLDTLLTQLGNYVESATGGDKAKIANTGFGIRAASLPVGELPSPDNLRASPSIVDGSANLRWQRVVGAKGYVIERAMDASGSLAWLPAGTSTRTKITLNTMTSGTSTGSAWQASVPPVKAHGAARRRSPRRKNPPMRGVCAPHYGSTLPSAPHPAFQRKRSWQVM